MRKPPPKTYLSNTFPDPTLALQMFARTRPLPYKCSRRIPPPRLPPAAISLFTSQLLPSGRLKHLPCGAHVTQPPHLKVCLQPPPFSRIPPPRLPPADLRQPLRLSTDASVPLRHRNALDPGPLRHLNAHDPGPLRHLNAHDPGPLRHLNTDDAFARRLKRFSRQLRRVFTSSETRFHVT